MVNSIAPGDWKRFMWAAIIGAVIFVLAQILPSQGSSSMEEESIASVKASKSKAEQQALQFAKEHFREEPVEAHTIYQTDSLAAGYFSKQKLTSKFDKAYGNDFPYDTFRVQLKMKDDTNAFVYVHMTTGKVVGWNWKGGVPFPEEQSLVQKATQAALDAGFRQEELTETITSPRGEVVFYPKGYKLGEANLMLTVGVASGPDGKPVINRYKAVFTPPADYVSNIDKQKGIANVLSVVSLLYMALMTLVLAIIYAVLYRRHTTFKRGLFISALFTIFYIYSNLDMMDGIMAQSGEEIMTDQGKLVMQIITVVMLVPVALAVYFSLVAGDGMWRSNKRPLWPGFREKGYGDHVWRSVGLSYLLALILLGLQSIIFIVLEKGIGSWSTTDATTSPYNIGTLWLLPTLAWCAAISEEAIYRLFGIAIFKRWFKNTFIASLIPTVMWALGHVGYPIFPFYTRVIELVILGLLFCFIFMRFGFITAVFTHAILDTLLMSLSLVATGEAINVTAAIIYVVLPVIIAGGIRYWHRKRFRPQPDIPLT
ncbi:CPBP family intramembrane glutamic endopeptidase [Paenibacillus radicis (ex Gao et al. 2016)]|uniref:CAAX prenyl protease 2/Lysostaphin resistance protein A-like domain-containing protein n=1 Tax=Paenibacillus radicis (ex Gao et al. 2016) TaxID=1737354 RepID=A0A917HDI4_9BACL|nr:CPBP family intramembrane glutamic endopeptidase [Paenibacillus radicis (ex Gao et al. 2016)]GGG75577.1 hypothetical protein GCM10010918_34850 [Paenibacillus radicis (ex Gao et al. 2016)]